MLFRALRLALCVLCVLGLAAAPALATLPAGFTDTLVANVALPTALAFTPDGRLLITTQNGTLRIVQGGSLLPTPALAFSASQICSNSERGLLGVAVDPSFASNGFLYLYYTFNSPGGCVNRVSRFTMSGNTVSLASELALIDNMPSTAGNHNAGDVHFGHDGYLYVTIGDGGCDWQGDSGCGGANDDSRDEYVLTGKVLRITKDGGIPPTNPFQGAGTARCNVTGKTTPGNKCQETFAWGLRNPFRTAFDPNDPGTRFFINDVGQSAWEEIDFGQAGVDYGWNCREGAHTNNTTGPCSPTPAGMVDPFFEYSHSAAVPGTSVTGCGSITGGAFVPNGLWPGYDNAYLFSDLNCGTIFKLTQGGGGVWTASAFETGLGGGSLVDLTFGPYGSRQALYYTTYAGGGQVRLVALPRPLDYFTLTPCRLLDTRTGGSPFAAGETRAVPAAGACGVPVTAEAIAVNLTVVGASSTGHLSLSPAGVSPSTQSAISFAPMETRSNNALVELGTGGAFDVLCAMPSGTADLIVDVVGYFATVP
jgi:glucose/arabinose dehydrogenase